MTRKSKPVPPKPKTVIRGPWPYSLEPKTAATVGPWTVEKSQRLTAPIIEYLLVNPKRCASEVAKDFSSDYKSIRRVINRMCLQGSIMAVPSFSRAGRKATGYMVAQ